MPSGSELTRRTFLGTLPIGALVAGCRRRPYRSEDFPLPDRSAVALLPAASYDVDLADVVSRGLTELRVSVAGKRVFLKPNLVEYERGTAINTNPLVVAAAATAFLKAGAREVVVGEGPGHRRDTEYLLQETGFYDCLKDLHLHFADLNHDDVRQVKLRSRFMGLEDLLLPDELLRSDFIVSMPKLKTHHWAALTASMKNFFGVVPGAVYGWPKNLLHYRGIDNSILDLVATIRPQMSIVDAIVAMEGDGPIMGRPRATGFIAMGTDVVAVDATCARIMGIDPEKVRYLAEASRFLGHIDPSRIDQRGEAPTRYQTHFEMLEHFKGLQLAGGA